MMDNKKFNFKIAFLVFSIVAFLVVLGSASFAFFSTNTADPNSVASIANANVTLPMGCTFIATPSASCGITGQTGSTVNYTDSIITSAEMTENHKGKSVAQSNCTLNVVVSGNKGCTCNYTVKIEKDSGDTYTPVDSSKLEFTATVKRGSTNVFAEANVTNGITSSSYLTVSSTSPVYHLYEMNIKFYNTTVNQGNTSGTNVSGKNFRYKLSAYATKCNGATPSTSSPTYSMLNSQNNVGQGAFGVFRSDADLSKLSGVQIDGQTIPSSNYTTSSGSTIIRLKPEYTSTLSLGNHSIKIVSNDGYATSNFTVDNPITFTIDNVGTFYASEGMTWADWISSYGISAGDNGIVWICYSSLCGNNGVGRLAVDIGNGIGDNNITNPDHSGYTLYNDIIINNANYHVGGPS